MVPEIAVDEHDLAKFAGEILGDAPGDLDVGADIEPYRFLGRPRRRFSGLVPYPAQLAAAVRFALLEAPIGSFGVGAKKGAHFLEGFPSPP
jgi:hypothetical protein